MNGSARILRLAGLAVSVTAAACGTASSGGWESVEGLPQVTSINAVWALAPDDVWVAADATMVHFDGAVWTATDLDPPAGMIDIFAFSPSEILAVGGTTLARYDGTAWTLEDLSAANAGISSVAAIWAFSPSDVWVSGDQSTAAHFDGTTWTRYIAAGTENTALWGSGPTDVYVGGIFDVAHWDGTTWTNIEDIDHGASAIYGFGPDDVWVADDDRLAHFDGTTWEPFELDGIGGVDALWGASSDDLWGAGSAGAIMRWTGAGWHQVRSQRIGSPYLQRFVGIHGSSSADVWAVGVQYGDAGGTPLLFHHGE